MGDSDAPPTPRTTQARLFDRRDKQEALTAIRSMLDDPTLHYRTIAQRFGITRQRVAQIAAEMGFNGRLRQDERTPF